MLAHHHARAQIRRRLIRCPVHSMIAHDAIDASAVSSSTSSAAAIYINYSATTHHHHSSHRHFATFASPPPPRRTSRNHDISLETPSSNGVSKLSSYISLFPRNSAHSRYAAGSSALHAPRPISHDEHHIPLITHAPLRTRMKSDTKFAVPSLNRLKLMSVLPFSKDAYKNMLATPFVFERQKGEGEEEKLQQDVERKKRKEEKEKRRKLGEKEVEKQIKLIVTKKNFTQLQKWLNQEIPSASAASSQTPNPHSSFLQILTTLSHRSEHSSVVEVYEQVLRPYLEGVLLKLENATSEVGGGAESASSSSTSSHDTLRYLITLSSSNLLSHSLSLTLRSCYALNRFAEIKEILAKLQEYQSKQQYAYDVIQWNVGVEMSRSGGASSSSSSSSKTDSGTSLSSLLASHTFQPYQTHPYITFIDTLMVKHSETDVGKEKKQNETDDVALATDPTPKIKPALQLFNRLITTPTSGPSNTNGTAAASSSSSSLPYNRLLHTMLRGVNKLCQREVEDCLRKYENVFKAANEYQPGKKDSASSSTLTTDPLSSFSLDEVCEVLQDIATKKHEALELLQGISLHVLQSYVAGPTSMEAESDGKEKEKEEKETAAAAESDKKPLVEEAEPELNPYQQAIADEIRKAKEEEEALTNGVASKEVAESSQPVAETTAESDESDRSTAIETTEDEPSTSVTTSSDTAISSSTGTTAESYVHRSLRLLKLLLCFPSTSTPTLLAPNKPHPSTRSGSSWQQRLDHQMTRNDIMQQREMIQNALKAEYAGRGEIFPDSVLQAAHYTPTPSVEREIHNLLSIQKTQHKLLHTALNAFISLQRTFTHLEKLGEKLRTRAEYLVYERLEQYSYDESLGLLQKGATSEFRTKAEQLTAIPYPETTVRNIHAILSYMIQEQAVALDRHSLVLLLSAELFGGASSSPHDSRCGIRYNTLQYAGIGTEKLGSLSELEQGLTILQSCGPAYRRIPLKVKGVTSDFVSSVLINYLLPRPISLFDSTDAIARSQGRTKSATPSESSSQLFTTFSQACLGQMEHQRRLVEKKEKLVKRKEEVEGIMKARGQLVEEVDPLTGVTMNGGAAFASSSEGASGVQSSISFTPATASATTTSSSGTPASTTTSSSGGLTDFTSHLPFTIHRDTSGAFSRLHGALEYIWSHPLNQLVEEELKPNGFTQSAVLNEMRYGIAAAYGRQEKRMVDQSIVRALADPSSITDPSQREFSRPRHGSLARLHRDQLTSDRERDLVLFRKHTNPRSLGIPEVKNVQTSMIQIPQYIVSPQIYSDLLCYYDRCNDLPAAINLLDRMSYSWIYPSWRASLALVSLAGKFMNYELMSYYVETYCLKMRKRDAMSFNSSSSSSNRRHHELWSTLMRTMSRYNSFSNIDESMKFLYEMIYEKRGAEREQQQMIAPQAQVEQPKPEEKKKRGRKPKVATEPLPPLPIITSFTPPIASLTSHTTRSFSKPNLDALWKIWIARGGAKEVMIAWNQIREDVARRGASSANTPVILDSASIDAYIDGLLYTSSSHSDAVRSLSSTQFFEAIQLLLRHISQYRVQLTPQQISRLSLDVVLRLGRLHGLTEQQSLINTFISGESGMRRFQKVFGVEKDVLSKALWHEGNVDGEGARVAIRNVVDSEAQLQQQPASPSITTPTSLRVSVVMQLLKDLNQSIHVADGVDATIDRLERALGGGANTNVVGAVPTMSMSTGAPIVKQTKVKAKAKTKQ